MNAEQGTGASFGRSGAGGALLRSARDGTLVHFISVGLILTILIAMAVMFQVFLAKKISLKVQDLGWRPFERQANARSAVCPLCKSVDDAVNLAARSESPPLELDLEERQPDFPGTPRYTLLNKELYLDTRKSICIFRAKNSGLTRHGITYDLSIFPYHLCTHAIYWYASVDRTNHLRAGDLEVDVVQNGFRKFPGLKSANPFLRVFIGVEDDSGLHHVSQDSGSTVNFTLKSLRWVVEHRYDGIFLRWAPPMKDGSSQFPSLTLHMLRTFKRVRQLTVGVVVPVYSPSADFYPDLSRLVNILGPHSIVVDPLATASTSSYFKNLFPYTAEALERYGKLFDKAAMAVDETMSPSLCYPLSIAGYSLALDDSGSLPARKAPEVLVNHQQLSGLAVAPYDSTCLSSGWSVSIRLRFGVLAARKSQWVTYQDTHSLEKLLDAMANVTGGASCLGVWDPEFDDFPGHCASGLGVGSYPLTRTIFEGRSRMADLRGGHIRP
ncbi:unnamed protein product [Ixodes hexagonus]